MQAVQEATNERLCELIQDGQRDLIPALWEQVRPLYDMKAGQYFRAHTNHCKAAGAELDDLRQAAFFGFLQTVEAYDRQKGLKFTAFIAFPLLTAFAELCGTRTSKQDPLRDAVSLDAPLPGTGGDGEPVTLADAIADPCALAFLDALDAESAAALIRAEVQTLRPALREIITAHYFSGDSLQEIAERRGVSFQAIQAAERTALRELSRRRNLRELYGFTLITEQLRERERVERRGRADELAAYSEAIEEAAAEADRQFAELIARAQLELRGLRTEISRLRAISESMKQ